jgi:hypothetical protein
MQDALFPAGKFEVLVPANHPQRAIRDLVKRSPEDP